MENTSTVKSLVDSLEGSIASLDEALLPLLETKLEDRLAKCETPEEKAKVYHDHIYITNSIIFACLKASGVKTEDHPIMKELERTKQSINKLKKAKLALEEKANSEEEAQKRTAEFLKHTLGTTGGLAVPESMKSPAISSANFKGKHTRFNEDG
ncbi:hypothetical protein METBISCDRAFT_17718 [Metschnikowia bicuspidata]|uniref:Exosome complex protein n=1 Tax=Metschnikowia bicuspidata TaxID=27322 RepID=A0A4P9ZAQ3_9ASCO|nr:hypothetical protein METBISCDRAFT_17718 [Metschnikowia bicuspidata]